MPRTCVDDGELCFVLPLAPELPLRINEIVHHLSSHASPPPSWSVPWASAGEQRWKNRRLGAIETATVRKMLGPTETIYHTLNDGLIMGQRVVAWGQLQGYPARKPMHEIDKDKGVITEGIGVQLG